MSFSLRRVAAQPLNVNQLAHDHPVANNLLILRGMSDALVIDRLIVCS